MSEMQFRVLGAMLFIGIPGVLVAMEPSNSRKLRIAGAVWTALWWLPPLVLLWIKGVFG